MQTPAPIKLRNCKAQPKGHSYIHGTQTLSHKMGMSVRGFIGDHIRNILKVLNLEARLL